MNVRILLGSRNPSGQTARAVDSLRGGMRQAGGSCDTVFLPECKIQRCRQCDERGWGLCREEGRCVIEDDDFGALCRSVKESDLTVFATPVYWASLSESLRAFTDRLRRTATHESGKAGICGKPAMGICVAGGSGGGSCECAFHLEQVMSTTGFRVLDVIAVRRQNLELKRESLRVYGEAVVKSLDRES